MKKAILSVAIFFAVISIIILTVLSLKKKPNKMKRG